MSKLSHAAVRSTKIDHQALDVTISSALGGAAAKRELRPLKKPGQLNRSGSFRGKSSDSENSETKPVRND